MTHQDLSKILHEGNGHSLVIASGSGTTVYDTSGIATLLQLVKGGEPLLSNASVADKVVGKAAAALMLLGGVKQVHAALISQSALELLNNAHVPVTYETLTPHIINRAGTGWCPMELACRPCATPQECLAAIEDKLQSLSHNQQ